MTGEPEELEVAVRSWMTTRGDRYYRPGTVPRNAPGPSDWVLVFDTETTTDHVQRLRFGGWQAYGSGILHRQGLFYDPDAITDGELEVLEQLAGDQGHELHLAKDWIEDIFFTFSIDLAATVVGHNLFFDLTRIAIGHDTTRSRDPRMRGGFSLKLTDAPTRPRVLVKRASPSATFIQFTVPDGRPPEQRQAERGVNVPPYRGFFVDTASAANALLGGKWSLERLARALQTNHQKTNTELDGPVSEETVDYCLNDVTVTWECYTKLAARYESYHLDVPLHRIVSEASVGKAHLAQMRIKPWRQLQPEFPNWLIAILMETYYGGRTECHIRRIPTRGVYVDFLSEYPTVYVLQNLWRYQIAQSIEWIAQSIEWEEINPDEINELLSWIEAEDLLYPTLWSSLQVVVQPVPEGDLLPTRARYKPGSPLFNVGLAHRYGVEGWWTLAEVIAAKLENDIHRPPRVIRAIRFTPGPIQQGMRSINIAGQPDFRIDPYGEDFIQRLIELRSEARRLADQAKELSGSDAQLWETLQHGLKVTANSVAYGIGIEINTTTHRKPVNAVLNHTDGTSTPIKTRVTEREGSWFNPLIATLTAAGGRLLLATLIRLVRNAGGGYVYCDTDSLFIAGLGRDQVQAVVNRFEALNPYEPSAVPGSILKIEAINYDAETGEWRDLYAYSIASKRYALFTKANDGRYRLARERDAEGLLVAKRSEHGLGHLQAPSKVFEDQLWEWMINTDEGHDWPEPDWFDQPALGRTTINTPYDIDLLKEVNLGKRYTEQIRPGGFLTIAHAHPVEQPGLLIAPYSKTTERAMSRSDWIHRITGASGLTIRTDQWEYVIANSVAVLDYRHYAGQYKRHYEWKAAGASIGLLRPRTIASIKRLLIGKETSPLASELPLDTDYSAALLCNVPCGNCGARLRGRQRRWCSERCRSTARRPPRLTSRAT